MTLKKSNERAGPTTYQGSYVHHEAVDRGDGTRKKADGESNKLSSEMAAIQSEKTKGIPTHKVKEKLVTRRNRHAPVQTKYICSAQPFVGDTVSRSSYKHFEERDVLESSKVRLHLEQMRVQASKTMIGDLESTYKTTCTSDAYVDHGIVPTTQPVVPVKFAGDGRVFTTSKRTQYRDAFNDHQAVDLHRIKPKPYTPLKAKFSDTTTNQRDYQGRLLEARRINGDRVTADSGANYDHTALKLPLGRTTTYTAAYVNREVQPRQREHRVTPTEPVVPIKFRGQTNSQISYVTHPKELYLS